MSFCKNRCSGSAIDFWERKSCGLIGKGSVLSNCLLRWGVQKDWNADGDDDDDNGGHCHDGNNYVAIVLEETPLLLLVQLIIWGIILEPVLKSWKETLLSFLFTSKHTFISTFNIFTCCWEPSKAILGFGEDNKQNKNISCHLAIRHLLEYVIQSLSKSQRGIDLIGYLRTWVRREQMRTNVHIWFVSKVKSCT